MREEDRPVSEVLIFLGGMVVGACVGVFIMALCIASSREDRRRERDAERLRLGDWDI